MVLDAEDGEDNAESSEEDDEDQDEFVYDIQVPCDADMRTPCRNMTSWFFPTHFALDRGL